MSIVVEYYRQDTKDRICFRHAVLLAQAGVDVKTEIDTDYCEDHDMAPTCKMCDAEAHQRELTAADDIKKQREEQKTSRKPAKTMEFKDVVEYGKEHGIDRIWIFGNDKRLHEVIDYDKDFTWADIASGQLHTTPHTTVYVE